MTQKDYDKLLEELIAGGYITDEHIDVTKILRKIGHETSFSPGDFFTILYNNGIDIFKDISEIPDFMFSGSTLLKNIKIPNNITQINNNAFSFCKNLESVELPDSIKEISSFAFENDPKLKDIKLSEGLRYISSSVFKDCKSLEYVEIPDSVEYGIQYATFKNCEHLKSIKLSSNMTFIDSYAFEYCSRLKDIVIPDAVEIIYEYAFSNCSSLKSIFIPKSVKTIRRYSFYHCEDLTIYCEAESKPAGWDETWNHRWFNEDEQIKTVWGAKRH